jgi:hypothetical protein
LVGEPDVHQDDVVVIMVNDAIEECNELCVLLRGESALEYRELEPFTETLHEPEYPAPAFRVGDVVGHYVKVLIAHGSPRREVRVLKQLAEQVTGQEACL